MSEDIKRRFYEFINHDPTIKGHKIVHEVAQLLRELTQENAELKAKLWEGSGEQKPDGYVVTDCSGSAAFEFPSARVYIYPEEDSASSALEEIKSFEPSEHEEWRIRPVRLLFLDDPKPQ